MVDGMGDLGDCGGVERGGISIESGGFAGECRKSESWKRAAVGVKADGLVVIPAVGENEGEKGKEMGSWRGTGMAVLRSDGGGGGGLRRRRREGSTLVSREQGKGRRRSRRRARRRHVVVRRRWRRRRRRLVSFLDLP